MQFLKVLPALLVSALQPLQNNLEKNKIFATQTGRNFSTCFKYFKMKKNILVYLAFCTIFFSSCSDDSGNSQQSDSFDRQAMLTNWADNIIIPAFQAFKSETTELKAATEIFTTNPTVENLQNLRTAHADAYLQFQTVSMFEIGRADNISYRARMNIYPTDAAAIQQKIIANNYNLELSTSFDEQGLPAMDFLLNGLAGTDAEIVSYYSSNENAATYKAYLNSLAERMDYLTGEVLNDWATSYKDAFISNTSSSSTGSVDKFTNDFVMYYEKFLRSGKVGIPSGVFTGNPVSDKVEAYYSPSLSKALYLKALNSTQDFFNGKHFNSNIEGIGYDDYLDYLNTIKNEEDLSVLINNQFDEVRAQATNLNDSFAWQVENNNSVMLAAFDELQMIVVHLKVDMMQALSISVDYVDSDGD